MKYYYFGDLSSIIKDLLTMNMQQKEQTWKDMLSNMESYSKFNKYDDCSNVTMDITIDNKTVSFRMTETDPFNKIKLHLDADCKNSLDFQIVYQPHDNVLQNQSGTIGLISLDELSKLNQINLNEIIEFIKLKNTGFVFGINDNYFVQLESEIVYVPELVKLYNDLFDDLDNDYIYVTKQIPKTYHYLILSKKSEHQVIARCSTQIYKTLQNIC